ncbi:MAG: hypothetical protein AAF911_00845 [Planctomycetota bacterium]
MYQPEWVTAAAGGLSVVAVVGLGIAVNQIEGRRLRTRNLNELAARFDSAGFMKYRVDAWRYVVENLEEPWDSWLYDPNSRDRNAVYAVVAFYGLIAQSIYDRSIDLDAAVRFFGATFVWWYVHLYRRNCRSISDLMVCREPGHRYDPKGAHEELVDRFYIACVGYPRLGQIWLDLAYKDLGRNQIQARRR